MTPSDLTSNTNHVRDSEQHLAAVPEKSMEDEHRAAGGVKMGVYWAYIRAGKLRWWLVLLWMLTVYRLIAIGQTWFLKRWRAAYNQSEELIISNPFERLPVSRGRYLILAHWGFFLIAAAKAVMFLVS